MKKTLLLILTLLALLVFYSCEKDDNTNIEERQFSKTAETRTSDPTGCGYIDELCEKCGPFTIPDDIIIVFENGSTSYEIVYDNFFEASTEFKINNGSSNYIITNTQKGDITSESLSTQFPAFLKNLYRLNDEKLKSRSYTKEQMQNDLGVNVTRTADGKYKVNTTEFNKNDDDVSAVIIDDCYGHRMKMMEKYEKYLNSPNVIASGSTWKSFFDPAFEKVARGKNLDIECVNPRDVIDEMLKSSISEDAKNKLKSNYLGLLLSLSPEDTDKIYKAGKSLIDEIYKTTKCGTINFCPTIEDQNTNVATAVNNMINSNNISVLGYYESLNSYDFIIPAPSFETNKKAKCIWDKILKFNDGLMCETLANFFDQSKKNLYLYIGTGNGQNGYTGGPDPKNGGYYIVLDSIFVNEACPVEIVKTLLHESIHAEILRRLGTYSISELNVLYPDMMSYKDDPKIINFQHEYMANHWFDKLLDAIKAFYPGLKQEEYKALVWLGLHKTEAFKNSGYTVEDLIRIRNNMRKNCDKSCD